MERVYSTSSYENIDIKLNFVPKFVIFIKEHSIINWVFTFVPVEYPTQAVTCIAL